MDYVAGLKKPAKFSRQSGSRRLSAGECASIREQMAQQVRIRGAFLQQDNPRLSDQKAFLMATNIVLKQNPGAAKAYREASLQFMTY